MSDIVVLGGGPGGYAVALRAVARGQSVTVIEADKVGGTCLHWGCIPSKAMLYVGGLLDEVRDAKRVGLDLAVNDVSVAGINAFREKVQNNLYKGLSSLMKGKGIEVVNGHGTVADDGRTVLVDGATTSRHTAGTALVLATGSKVRSLPGVDVDRTVVITSDEATRLPRIPRRALVIGSGAVGLEFASLWRSLGAEEVTVVEALDRIAPLEDPDLSKQLARNYRKRGITTVAGAMVESVKVEGDTATVRFGDQEVTVDTVLVAVGRAPRTDGIGLEQLGVVNDRGYIEVDQWQRTSAEGVYAVGDLLPPPALALAHAGFAEGFLAADVIAQDGDPQPIDYAQVPRVTYTSPE
ncbi:MAG TPA: FAD-dependent oxidoreductase, partial [Egibacteraceae bacterium]|nr:FAD-dependent oxidoreductase [Egibacteraceae bacterium]